MIQHDIICYPVSSSHLQGVVPIERNLSMDASVLHGSRHRITTLLIIIILVLSFLPMLSFMTQAHATGSHTYSSPFILTFKGKPFTFVQNSAQPPSDAQ